MKTDFVIIGSGVAAASLAWKVLRADTAASILILEAGVKMKMRDFAVYQDYLVTNREPHGVYWDKKYPERDAPGENKWSGNTEVPLEKSRLTMYGGSTVHWGGWSFRLKEEDFRLHSNTGKGIDWPFDYDQLEKFYCEAEYYLGVSGDHGDGVVHSSRAYPFKAFPYTFEDKLAIDALRKLNYSYSHLPIARQGVSGSISSHAPCQTTGKCKYCPFGSRYAASNALDDLQFLEAHPNLVIRTGVVVEEILMDSKEHATGLRCLDRNTSLELIVEAETIIVASGAIESPKLLHRSGHKFWAQGLGNDNDLVGRNLVTHPYFTFEARRPGNSEGFQPEMGFPTLVSRHFDSVGEQKAGKFILVNPPESPRYGPDKQDLARMMQAGLDRQEIIDRTMGTNHPVSIQWQGMVEVFSVDSNRVYNLDSINRFGLHETLIHHNRDEGFDKRLSEIGEHVSRLFEEMGATPVVSNQSPSWRADHAACTTRMSDDPLKGVVDSHMKVHGTKNVYVCSNSCFSSLGAVNPTLTLTALSLRLGAHLTGQTESPVDSYACLPGDLALSASDH